LTVHDERSPALTGRRSALVWALTALALAPGAPVGLWLLFRVAGIDPSNGPARLALIYSGVATALVFAAFGYWTGRLMDRLRRAALHDGLTGLFNRRFLRESLPQLQAVAARRGSPLCVVMLDLDHFKQVNDRHGHLVGDKTLAAVGRTLREHGRRSDLVARYGGEEFAVLCPDTDCATGLQVAERLRVAIEQLGPEVLGHPGPQTVSLGVAVQSPKHELTPEQLLDHADLALYRAKHRGRNRAIAWLDGQELVSLPADAIV
jgi:diguanylate cyclase (GGDEF)-like protein